MDSVNSIETVASYGEAQKITLVSIQPVYRYTGYVITIFSALLLQFSMESATKKTTLPVWTYFDLDA